MLKLGKNIPVVFTFAVLVFFIFLLHLISAANSVAGAGALPNSTGIGSSNSWSSSMVDDDDDDEFLMESEMARRSLQQQGGRGRRIQPLDPSRPFCNRNVYGDCVSSPRPYRRPCSYRNLCDRLGHPR